VVARLVHTAHTQHNYADLLGLTRCAARRPPASRRPN